jgi:hypothetical protein
MTDKYDLLREIEEKVTPEEYESWKDFLDRFDDEEYEFNYTLIGVGDLYLYRSHCYERYCRFGHCVLEDNCNSREIEINIPYEKIHLDNKILVSDGECILYYCQICGLITEINVGCFTTAKAFMAAFKSDFPIKLVCPDCMQTERLCFNVHEHKESAIHGCWTKKELKEMKANANNV